MNQLQKASLIAGLIGAGMGAILGIGSSVIFVANQWEEWVKVRDQSMSGALDPSKYVTKTELANYIKGGDPITIRLEGTDSFMYNIKGEVRLERNNKERWLIEK